MAKNINQIYATTPLTSLPAGGLIYIGDNGIDSAIQVGDIYNTTNLQLTAGKLNTIQDITTASNVVFSQIKTDVLSGKTAATTLLIQPNNSCNLNVLLNGASMTIGSAAQMSISATGVITGAVWNAGIIPLAYGGTNANLTAANGAIPYSTGTAIALLAAGSSGQLFQSSGAGAPAWTTTTYPTTTTVSQLLYSSSANTVAGLSTVNSSVLTTNATGVPTWLSMVTNGGLLIGSGAGVPVVGTLTGTANQVVVTNAANSITLSTPQDIGTASAVRFGTVAVGSSLFSNSTFSSTATTAYNSTFTGNQTAQDGLSAQYGVYVSSTFAPSAQVTTQIATVYLAPLVTVPDVTNPAIANAYGLWIKGIINGTAGKTLTNWVSLNISSPTLSTATLTNAYSATIYQPTVGTNRVSLFAEDLSINVNASGTPTKGTIRTAPPASNTVTTAFVSTLTFGTAVQNTTGYDIEVEIGIIVTAATTATIVLGVSSSATPTTNTVVASFSTTGVLTLSAYVPHNYYLLVDKTGSLTQTNSVVAMAV